MPRRRPRTVGIGHSRKAISTSTPAVVMTTIPSPLRVSLVGEALAWF
jgi:hypothetical protein